MDFWKTLLVLMRRWYVAGPVLLVSLGSAAMIYTSVPMRYQSEGVVVFTAPVDGPSDAASLERGSTNPLLAFEDSLAVSVSIVTQSLNTPTHLQELVGSGTGDSVEITDDGVFIGVVAESTDQERAHTLVVTALEKIDTELEARQNELGAPPSTFIVVDPVVPPTEPTPQVGSKMRAAGAALILSLAASLGSVYAVESILEGRRRRGVQQNPARPSARGHNPSRQSLPLPNAARQTVTGPQALQRPGAPGKPGPPAASAGLADRSRW